jgi:hypothetical protein
MVHLAVPFLHEAEQLLFVVEASSSALFSEQQTAAAEFAALLCLVQMTYSSVLYGRGVKT